MSHRHRCNAWTPAAASANAWGIDTLQSIFPDRDPKATAGAVTSATKKKLQDAEDSFENSDLLKKLRQQTTDNTKKYDQI